MPEVSVIMPSYNHSPFLRKSIESVLNQDFADLELIIVDDASSDDSADIIKEYLRRDRRVGAIIHGRNMGISRTVNDGIAAASGNYIALTASDDVWKSNKLSVQMEAFKNYPNVVQWSEADVIDRSGKPLKKTYTQIYNASDAKKSGDIFNELLKMGNFLSGQTIIVSRENLADIRFDEELVYLGDFKLELQLAAKCSFLFYPQSLAEYRIHNSNSIQSDKRSWDNDWIKLSSYLMKEMRTKIGYREMSNIRWERGRSFIRLGSRAKASGEFFKSFWTFPPFFFTKAARWISFLFGVRVRKSISAMLQKPKAEND